MAVDNLRKYGEAPFDVVLVHGGPGAAGEMAPVCRRLAASEISSLEPLQTALSLKSQVEELRDSIVSNARTPAVLVGFSWGAWLSLILASEYPELVKKLVLIGAGAFEEKYVKELHAARMVRLSVEEKKELDALLVVLDDPSVQDKTAVFKRFGALFSKADSFAPMENAENCEIDFSPGIYNAVWPEAAAMRKSGELMELSSKVKCPVVAIHGDYDPHSSKGVREPLSSSLSDFRFIQLEKCGHKPWIESCAAERFYEVLRAELV